MAKPLSPKINPAWESATGVFYFITPEWAGCDRSDIIRNILHDQLRIVQPLEMDEMLTPIGDRAILRPIEKADRIGEILLPASFNAETVMAEVISAGQGYTETGAPRPQRVQSGDRVMIHHQAGFQFPYNGVVHYLVNVDEIIGRYGSQPEILMGGTPPDSVLVDKSIPDKLS